MPLWLRADPNKRWPVWRAATASPGRRREKRACAVRQPLGGSARRAASGMAVLALVCVCTTAALEWSLVWSVQGPRSGSSGGPCASDAHAASLRASSPFLPQHRRPYSHRAPSSSTHHAQDNQLHRPGSARVGKNGAFCRLPVLEDEPRHARHRADKAALDRDERPARDPARHAGQPVLQRALLVEPRGARPRRHHVGEPGGKGALDPSGRHGRGHAHAQAACPRAERRQPAQPVSGRQ
jgi:hypothetical protein